MTTRQLLGGTVLLLAGVFPMQARGQRARLRGRVFDSVAALPLAGARVQLVDADDRSRIAFSTTSDSLGRFVVDSVARGHYIAGFLHPMLDSLGLVLSQRQLVIDNEGEVPLELAVPAPERLEGALCGKTSEKDSLGVVLGYILNAHSFAPIDDATVVAQWAEFAIGSDHVSRTLLYRTARTGAEGWFALCGVPSGSSVILRAVTGSDTSGAIEVDVPKSRVARRTVYVDHQPAPVASPAESASAALPGRDSTTGGHHATLHGWVRTEDGVPIPGARVGIFSSDTVTVTNADGEFELTGIPGGTQTLITRAIGFVPDERAVDLTDHHYAITVGLLAIRRFLDTVHVHADRNSFTSAVGFEDRRKGGAGRFFTATDVERLHPQELTDLLRHTPLLDLSTDNAHNVKIRVRGDQVACTPAIFVDGKQLVYWELADLNSLIQPDELVGMEVYSAAMTPAEFRTKNSCGTLVVWTRTPERLHSRR